VSEAHAAQGSGAAVEAIRGYIDYLGTALATWEARSETRPDAHARRSASDAVDLIDDALAGLHALRQRLISQVRASDDAHAKAVDELLAGGRGVKAHERPA
jgi:hypothetical protein